MNTQINLENIIRNLSRYASGDNAQPFLFQIDAKNLCIKVFHDADIAFHSLNPENLMSLVSFGMIIQMMAELSIIYSFEFDFSLAISEAEVSTKGRVHWGTFNISSFPEAIPETPVFIDVNTNRMNYKNESINFSCSDEDIQMAGKLNAKELKLILTTESILWRNSKTLNHIFYWAHLTTACYQKARAGFHYTELNMDFFESLLIPFFKSKTWTKIVIFIPIVKYLSWIKSKKVLEHTPNIIGIYNEINSRFDLIEIGKKAYKIKFILAKKGIVTQPLSLITFPYICHKINPKNTYEAKKYKNVQQVFKKKFQLNSSKKEIAWLFRVGYPEIILPSALRRDISDIIIP